MIPNLKHVQLILRDKKIENDSKVKKINVSVDFSRELISNSENLDSEFSKIVSDNFFDLLQERMTFNEEKANE
jgi:valyl-tRNA synthetase